MPTAFQVKECAAFLAEVVRLGARADSLRMVEDAWWLLQDNEPTPYDEVKPYLYNGQPDIDRVTAILQELGACQHCREAEDVFWGLAWWAGGRADGSDDAARLKAREMSVPTLWAVAVAILMARTAGVGEGREKELRALAVEATKG